MMSKRKASNIFLLIFLGLWLISPRTGKAQVDIEINPEDPEYTFGELIIFKAHLNFNEEIEEVLLFIQVGSTSDLQVHPVSLDDFGNLSAQIDLGEHHLVGFSDFEYWYQVNSLSGDTYTSPHYSFNYFDNRYQWRSLSGEPISVHWYQGDLAFGEDVLNVSIEALRSTQEMMEVFFPEHLDIYVYNSVQSLQAALPNGGQNWIAGHADPFQGVILVSLPPGADQRSEMERQIPHELMHVGLSFTDSHAYSNLPTWFNEGLASLVELYPNPEYPVLIENAFETDQLLPIASLCHSFPNDAQRGLLAYAQSASFSQYIFDQYGEPGFNRLMAAYASGMSCEDAVEQALGINLASLEANWLEESFKDLTIARTYQEFLPWLVLLLVVLAGPVILTISIIRRRPARAEL